MKIEEKTEVCITLSKEETRELKEALYELLVQEPEHGIHPKDKYPDVLKLAKSLPFGLDFTV